ncbi:MAG: hypothetical protein KVP17_001053 [Porospora cf. gigantea B]|uniref:uncharacterized protein n=1 Tax=Porospora cf. gigantea B TaxID=2853592 RepID=UPI003571B7AD|nr:MAG: hypothetical protein KVP17_001053 [Porospora cf. gigantea B]
MPRNCALGWAFSVQEASVDLHVEMIHFVRGHQAAAGRQFVRARANDLGVFQAWVVRRDALGEDDGLDEQRRDPALVSHPCVEFAVGSEVALYSAYRGAA